MQDRIIEFSNVLRRNGVRVSLSENIDAFRAIDLLGIENPLTVSRRPPIHARKTHG